MNGNDLSSLTKFIKDDLFWEKKYRNTFGHPCLETGPGKWLQVFMEKHLQDWLEKIKPGDNAEETLIKQLEIYSPFVHTLTMHNFQVPASTQHIPQFNIVLQNLAELKRIDLSVNVTDAGDDFVVGCSNLTESDIDSLATGIEFCDYLCDFRLSGTRLSGSMSKRLGRALEKCPNLKVLHLIECNLSDNGVISFLIGLSPESMQSIEDLDLSNNFICGWNSWILNISRIIKNFSSFQRCLPIGPRVVVEKTLEEIEFTPQSHQVGWRVLDLW